MVIVLYYLVFLIITNFIAMRIFSFSTYHKYFWLTFPILAGYSAFIAIAMIKLGMERFFVWHVLFVNLYLINVMRKMFKNNENMLKIARSEDVLFLSTSVTLTMKYYIYSCIVYMTVFVGVYIWFYNH